jgi:hypothetical protein
MDAEGVTHPTAHDAPKPNYTVAGLSIVQSTAEVISMLPRIAPTIIGVAVE